MLITDEQLQAAHDYLTADPHPLAEAQFRYALAQIAKDKRRAELQLEVQGKTVAQREARIELDNEYGDLRYREEEAHFGLTNEKCRGKGAEVTIALYQTYSANTRNLERVR